MKLNEHKKLERLVLFSEVATHLSFTLAAQSLGISRGHLSAQIRRLEHDMKSVLLVRSTRSVRLTPEGRRVLTGMDKIRQSLLELERTVEHETQSIEGLLKITAPIQFTERYLLDICSEFRQRHPNIEFSIDSSYKPYDLNRSHYDLAFRATNSPPEDMVAQSLLSYSHCCVAAPAYLMQYGRPNKPADIIKHQCLRSQDQPNWQFKEEYIAVEGWLKINDNHMLKRQALAGFGIIRVPDYLVDKEVENGTLERVLDQYMPNGCSIYLVHPQLIHQSKRLNTFLEFTKSKFK